MNWGVRAFEDSASARRNREGGARVFAVALRRAARNAAADIWGLGEELVRMGAIDAPRKAAHVRHAAHAMPNATPDAYNPDGGKRVQQAWQRYSNSPRAARRHCARPAGLAYPAACR
ncbi:hypothetical protein GCM10018785_45920 [Streptomyces longispororuber]|uniref:Uncharacterized protein n=1 Tax=Streptomyces longispororuber TaxID=68230 RepID=A0A919DS85_9ACTN|nr:hypothetical protein GCM10018785_45920 [Streptomyces longispororuber]